MKARGRRTATRVIGTVLLLLAVSPVTAPFLTYDIRDLLGDSSPQGAALVQPKTTHDEPTAAVGHVAVPVDLPVVFTTISVSPAPHGRVNRPAHVPLRV